MLLSYNLVPAASEGFYKKNYIFTLDYFTRNIPLWKQFLGEFKDKPRIAYLEIGVFEGGSLIWMLENILTHPRARATGVDIFYQDLYKRFISNLKLSGFINKVDIQRGMSQVMLRRLPLNSYDIIYIDGSHVPKDVLVDAVLSWGLLKKGGIMIFDDYMYKNGNEAPGVAIDAFIYFFKDNLRVLYKDILQVIVRKIS
jgi:predicted O-methyltransferase YrrM